MQGKLDTVGVSELIEMIASAGTAGVLRIRPGDEARVFFDGSRVVHAEYRQMRGMDAIFEVMKWKDDRFKFEAGRNTADRSVHMPVESLLLAAAEYLDNVNATGAMGPRVYHRTVVPLHTPMEPLERKIMDAASGVTLEDLISTTNEPPADVARTLKRLLDKHWLRSEEVSFTAEMLARTIPRKANTSSTTGGFSISGLLRSRTEPVLDAAEKRVLAAVDGRVSLEDIRVAAGFSREQVWLAYQRLVDLGRLLPG
jgi:hypothetical protein